MEENIPAGVEAAQRGLEGQRELLGAARLGWEQGNPHGGGKGLRGNGG